MVKIAVGDIMNSIWTKDFSLKKFNALESDIKTHTVIVGAGLAGLLTAYRLKENGIECVVLEANEICSGQTKNTSAKITSQHGEIYGKIAKYFGDEACRQYAMANEQAIRDYQKIIIDKNIDCDFEHKDAYLYSTKSIEPLKKELKYAQRAGIDCFLTDDLEIPNITKGALVFKNQAQFNPLKFAGAIAKELSVYEHTPVIKIIGNKVHTPKAIIEARNIVIATHYPFINFPSSFFLRMSRERSYLLALEGTRLKLNGMYIGIENETLSFRQYGRLLLLGGEAHRTGETSKTNHFDALLSNAKELFPKCNEVARWSAQDCITIDGLPYIGYFNNDNENIFVETGFKKWCMSTAMVSANIITDIICGRENKYSAVFSPQRFNLQASIGNILTNTFETVKGFSGHIIPTNCSCNDLPKNTAKEIKFNGHKAGAYRDENGTIYIVTLTCPHLKCKLNWNDTTKTWDCPCHGSRYTYKGELIDNPSQTESILLATK